MNKVFVAVSGGVDSAVAAHTLKRDGWDVTAVFIRVWQPDFLPCSQDEEERAALRVATHLGVPFKRLDLSDKYKRDVVDKMVSEYKAGRTPNPDVLCNATIKFGAFLDYALSEGTDKIATGHHARIEKANGAFRLLRGIDPSKDQSYFLWKLTQEELPYVLFPIGKMTKKEVRAYAQKHGIPSAARPDSQGLCFIGNVDMKTFLKNFIDTTSGEVLNERGNVVGTHEGAELVTLGQRSGFTITDKAAQGPVYYVVAKNVTKNTITVSTKQVNEKQASSSLELSGVNFIVPVVNTTSVHTCEIRYHAHPISCSTTVQNSTVSVFLEEDAIIAKGQSLVFYDGEICLGGGIVS